MQTRCVNSVQRNLFSVSIITHKAIKTLNENIVKQLLFARKKQPLFDGLRKDK